MLQRNNARIRKVCTIVIDNIQRLRITRTHIHSIIANLVNWIGLITMSRYHVDH